MLDNEVPAWILRNLRDFKNCAVSAKTFVEKGLERKIKALYDNVHYRYVETNDEVVTFDYCPKRRNMTMVYISLS